MRLPIAWRAPRRRAAIKSRKCSPKRDNGGITGRPNQATHSPAATPAKPHLSRNREIFPKQIRYLASPLVALHEACEAPVRPHLIPERAIRRRAHTRVHPAPANTHLWRIPMDSELSHHAVPAYVSREVATNFADSRISTKYCDPEKPHHSERRNLDFTEATSGNCGSRKASPQGGFERSDGRGLVTIPARNRAGSRESSPLALAYGRKAGFSRKDSLIERHLSRSISPTPCRARKRR